MRMANLNNSTSAGGCLRAFSKAERQSLYKTSVVSKFLTNESIRNSRYANMSAGTLTVRLADSVVEALPLTPAARSNLGY